MITSDGRFTEIMNVFRMKGRNCEIKRDVLILEGLIFGISTDELCIEKIIFKIQK